VVFDPAGNLSGTTLFCASDQEWRGIVFEVTPQTAWPASDPSNFLLLNNAGGFDLNYSSPGLPPSFRNLLLFPPAVTGPARFWA
jgi:hypothetical protein